MRRWGSKRQNRVIGGKMVTGGALRATQEAGERNSFNSLRVESWNGKGAA